MVLSSYPRNEDPDHTHPGAQGVFASEVFVQILQYLQVMTLVLIVYLDLHWLTD